jgi:hypothetical protein
MVDLTDVIQFFKNYSWVIASIGGIILILNGTGFTIDIPKYYDSLDVTNKILIVGLFNFVLTTVLFVIVLNRIENVKNMIAVRPKTKSK